MKLTRAQFRKRYEKPSVWVEDRMHEWMRNVRLGNRAATMLSEIPHYYHEGSGRSSNPTVRIVSGYRVTLIVGDHPPLTVAAYSPLIGGFVVCYSTKYYGEESEDLSLFNVSSLAHLPLSSDPLDDDTSRLVLMSDCVPSLNGALIQRRKIQKWMFRDNPTDDMMMNLVSCIKQQPQEKRDRLMVLLDKYGAPEGPLGEALMHIDKFRSM
jgi:hypothetical protein